MPVSPEVLRDYQNDRLWVRWGAGPYLVLSADGIECQQFVLTSEDVTELRDPDEPEHECCDCSRDDLDCDDCTQVIEMVDNILGKLLSDDGEIDLDAIRDQLKVARNKMLRRGL